MNDLISAGLAIGVGTSGTSLLLHALRACLPHIVAAWRSRERTAEVTAETVRDALDTMRGRLSRVEGDLDQAREDLRECHEGREEYRQRIEAQDEVIDALRAEIAELRELVADAKSVSIVEAAREGGAVVRMEPPARRAKGDGR